MPKTSVVPGITQAGAETQHLLISQVNLSKSCQFSVELALSHRAVVG